MSLVAITLYWVISGIIVYREAHGQYAIHQMNEYRRVLNIVTSLTYGGIVLPVATMVRMANGVRK